MSENLQRYQQVFATKFLKKLYKGFGIEQTPPPNVSKNSQTNDSVIFRWTLLSLPGVKIVSDVIFPGFRGYFVKNSFTE